MQVIVMPGCPATLKTNFRVAETQSGFHMRFEEHPRDTRRARQRLDQRGSSRLIQMGIAENRL